MPLNKTDIFKTLVDYLSKLNIDLYAGVTGGGGVHFLKHVEAYRGEQTHFPSLFTLSEYAAGFIPIGVMLRPRKWLLQ